MIKLTKTSIYGWEEAIRGMRNPKNSWGRIDSGWREDEEGDTVFDVGPNDADLMRRLSKGGPVHAKFRRMITVYVDIEAPLYWWKEFDTYKIGTVANSCSTMHKIHAKEFTLADFSHEKLYPHVTDNILKPTIQWLNYYRDQYNMSKNKRDWEQMIQMLPTSYNQLRTIELNYEVLTDIYHSRLTHKLDEWHEVCRWIESLPYSWIITGKENENGET